MTGVIEPSKPGRRWAARLCDRAEMQAIGALLREAETQLGWRSFEALTQAQRRIRNLRRRIHHRRQMALPFGPAPNEPPEDLDCPTV